MVKFSSIEACNLRVERNGYPIEYMNDSKTYQAYSVGETKTFLTIRTTDGKFWIAQIPNEMVSSLDFTSDSHA
jgi:hypothetical protein